MKLQRLLLMPKTITQKILFKNTTPKVLFDLYTNSKKHSLSTGADAKISTKTGGSFSAHGGYISGINLHFVKNKLIVQTWRGSNWEKEDEDSIFILLIEPKGKDSILNVTHANLPDVHAASIDKGWHDYYWKPWKIFLSGKIINYIEM